MSEEHDVPLLPRSRKLRGGTAVIGAVEEGVPIPERSRPRRYPWTELTSRSKCFHVASDDPVSEYNRVRSAAKHATDRYGVKYAVRRVFASDPKGQGVRVWRDED